MVGFLSDLSDTDDSAIDEIISQAKDACVLEQVAKINCSSFTQDSLLPTELETRFRKLKSFPAAPPPPPPPFDPKGGSFPNLASKSFNHPAKGYEQSPVFSPSEKNPHAKTGSDPKLPRGSVSSPSDSADSSHGKIGSKSKSKLGAVSPGSGSSHGSEEGSLSSIFKPVPRRVKSGSQTSSPPPSPPQRAGCLWCSPKKKDSPKKKKKSKEEVWGNLGWDKSSDGFLSDLGSFSNKEQQRILKKAMKEELKISREAEKIVEMAKQASARINVTGIEDELLSDED